MQTIHASQRTGADGTLSLHLPLGRPDTEFEVVVIVQAKGDVGNLRAQVDAIRERLAASGRDFGDSTDDVREDRDR